MLSLCNDMMNGTTPIHENTQCMGLSEEMILSIFSFLSVKELVTMSSVCKHWNNLCQDSSLWRAHLKHDFPRLMHNLESKVPYQRYQQIFADAKEKEYAEEEKNRQISKTLMFDI